MNGRVSRLLEFLGAEESGVFCETSWIALSRLINFPNLYDTNENMWYYCTCLL